MFRIKICGVTNVHDAIAAVDAGADAIGLNFYEKSSRYIDESQSITIDEALPETCLRVGVFVNSTLERICRLCRDRPDAYWMAQLHGDESLELIRNVYAQRDVVQVIRLRSGERPIDISSALEEYVSVTGRRPHAILLDAATTDSYGGTGLTLSWPRAAQYRAQLDGWNISLILAGGLTPDNVAEAIRIVRPHGVDVASGVESAPGKKDPIKVRDFIAAARAALDSLAK